MKNFDTIVFDFDGTLLDTLKDLTDSVNYVLNKYGYPVRSIDEIRRFLGNGIARLLELSIPNGLSNPKFKICLEELKEYYSKNMNNKTGSYKGINELLEQLVKKGYKIGVASNKFDEALKELNKQYFGKYIKVAIGQTENRRKKPAPDIVFKVLEELNSTADKAIYVGDSEVDVNTAKNSGLICVGVTWGFRDKEVLAQEGADYIIDKPLELLEILKENLN
jgi:phosphoglycolate phosphatase